MKARRHESTSFDLFLDTICNTFGGIVFLAILLAIMIQNRQIVGTARDSVRETPADEVRALILERDKLSAEKQALLATLATIRGDAPGQQDAEYFEKRKAVQQQELEFADLLEEYTKIRSAIEILNESNRSAEDDLEKLPEKLEGAKESLRRAEAAYAGLVEAKSVSLRLPQVRTSQAASMLLLVTGTEMFLAKKPTLFGQGFESQHVTTRSLPGGGIEVNPKPGSGWDLSTAKGIAEFERIVREARVQGHILTLAVWPNSYGAFTGLKDQMVKQDVFYQLWPQSESEKLVVFFGSGVNRIQ